MGRNDPCPCGSGRKHKKCCGAPPNLKPKVKAIRSLPSKIVQAGTPQFRMIHTPRDADPFGDKAIVTLKDIEDLKRRADGEPKIIPGK